MTDGARRDKRRQLNEILEAHAEELFHYVRAEIAPVDDIEQSLLEGDVLTGGGALLNGMCDMAERVLNCQTRNGLTIGIHNWPEELNNTAWTVAAGLSMYSSRLKLRRETRARRRELLNYMCTNCGALDEWRKGVVVARDWILTGLTH